MKVTILGSGTGIPKPDRAPPGFVVEFARSLVLVDPSAGSLDRMARLGLDAWKITHVVFSHFHPDHTGDLVPLLFAMNLPEYFPAGYVTLIGPTGLRQFHRGFTRVYGKSVRVNRDQVKFLEINEGYLRFEDWYLSAHLVDHTEDSHGYRFSEGTERVFAYSGDTGYCPNLVRLLKEADVALVECSHPSDAEATGHLTPLLAGKAALEGNVRRLLLTHLYPDCDGYDIVSELRNSGYHQPVEVASDGMQFEV